MRVDAGVKDGAMRQPDEITRSAAAALSSRAVPVTGQSQAEVLRWAHVVTWQVDRLRDSRLRAMRSAEHVRKSGYYGHEDAHPFQEMEGERLFVLISARQLIRALEAFDGDLRLPVALDRDDIELIRNAAEHWDEPEPTKGWAKKAAEREIDPTLHRWSREGAGLLGTILDEHLRGWASDVYEAVRVIDVWRHEQA